MTPPDRGLLADLIGRTEDMVRDVLALREVESHSESLTAQCAVVELAE